MCTPSLQPVPNQPGHYSAFNGMPALSVAAQRIAAQQGESDETRADAYCVLSYLEICNRPRDTKAAMKAMKRAVALRPNSGLQLDHRAALHSMDGDFASALADLTRARTLHEGPHAALLKHEATGNIGKCLRQLNRGQQAMVELERYVEEAISGQIVLTDRERGHVVVAEYMLVELLGNNGNRATRMLRAASPPPQPLSGIRPAHSASL